MEARARLVEVRAWECSKAPPGTRKARQDKKAISAWYCESHSGSEIRIEGIHISVVDMHTIKPLDEKMIETVAKECGCILTLEEHSIYGGLGGAVAEVVAQTDIVPLDICGIPDEDVPNGTDQEVFAYYKMDAEGIKERVKNLISKKSK